MAGIFDLKELPKGFKIRDLRPFLNSIVRAIIALRPARSPDFVTRTTDSGTTQKLPRHILGGSGSGSSVDAPFTITDATDSSVPATPVAKVTVTFGHVSNIIPTMDGDALSLGHAHTFSSANTYNGYLDFDGSAAVLTWSTSAVPATTGSNAYCLVGVVTVTASGSGFIVSSISQGVFSSFMTSLCSGSNWVWNALGVII